MADLDFLKYWKYPDFVGPVEAALRLHESRLNEETQRMFAQNQADRQKGQMERESAEEHRRQADFEQKRKDEKAAAIEKAGRLARLPGGIGPAQALIESQGGQLAHPAAPPVPQEGDAVDQFLRSQGVGSETPDLGPPTPPPAVPPAAEAPPAVAAPPPPPVENPLYQTVGTPMPPQVGLDPTAAFGRPKNFIPSGVTLTSNDQPPEEPPPNVEPSFGSMAPVVASSSEGAAPADLEALMARAMPKAPPPAPPANLLYEAILDGHHYPINAEPPKFEGLSQKWALVAQADMAAGRSPEMAFERAIKGQQEDEGRAASEKRLIEGIGARGAQQDKTKSLYDQTATEKGREADERTKAIIEAARLRAASTGYLNTPKQRDALTVMLRMKEAGMADSDIEAFGAEHNIDPKAWNVPVKNVQSEAASGARITERRAGQEVKDENGKVVGVANSQQEATTLSKQTKAWAQVEKRYSDLINDIKENGARINPLDIKAVQRRNSLASLAQGAGRVYNQFGATDKSQELEGQTMQAAGTAGHGLVMGANADVIEHLLDEARQQHEARLHVGLRAGGGQPLPAPITHEKPKGGDDLDGLLDFARSLPGHR